MELPKHFCKFKGHEAVVCGYRPSMNQCMIVLIGSLPQDEGMELRRIAMSSVAQEHDYLVPTLQVELHKSQADWFSHLCTRMKRNDGAVVEISIKELDDMNPHQKSFFKGDGTWVAQYNDRGIQVGRKWARNKTEEAAPPATDPALLANPSTTSAGVGGMLTEDASLAAETARVAAQTAGPVSPVDPTLAAILWQLVEGQREMTAAVNKLTNKVKPATKRKTAGKRKTPAKKVSPSVAAVNG